MVPQNGSTATVNVKALAHGGRVLVATGCVNVALDICSWANNYNGMWMRSTDGVHWTFAATPAPSESVNGVVHDGQRFVAVGNAGKPTAPAGRSCQPFHTRTMCTRRSPAR